LEKETRLTSRRAGGSAIREPLQQLQKAELVAIEGRKGRKLTKQGLTLLTRLPLRCEEIEGQAARGPELMSGEDYSDEELEELRRRRMASSSSGPHPTINDGLKPNKQVERQKQAIIRKILTPEARQRLTNIRMVKPEFAEELEMQLIQLAQSGRLQGQVTDEQLKRTLVQLQGQKKEIKIRRG